MRLIRSATLVIVTALELATQKKDGLSPVAILSPVAVGFGIHGPYNIVVEKER